MKDKLINLLLPLSGLILLAFCVLIFATTSHAAGEQDYFPMFQNGNNLFSETLKNALNRDLDPENNFIIVKYGYVDGPFTNFYYISVPKDSTIKLYGEKYNNLTQFSVYHTGNGVVRCYLVNYLSDGTMGGIFEASMSEFQGCFSSNYSNSVSYISNFQLYTDNTSAKQIVLLYDDGVSIPSGDTAREDMEKPDLSNYIPDWTTPPNFDNSSVESALESVYDIISWLGSNIKDTIKGSANYVVDSLMWGFQRVLDTIRNKIDEVKTIINNAIDGVIAIIDNIKGTVNNIKVAIDYIGEPLQSSEVNTAFTSTNFYGVKSQFTSTFTNFENAFDISEPNTFTLTINIQNIETFYNFGCRSPVIIHLDEHFTPIKTALRTFLWILISFGTVFVVDKGLANWLRGERKE